MTTCIRHIHNKFYIPASSVAEDDTCTAEPSVDFWDFSLKDTLKVFGDFRNKQQKYTKKFFLICKSMYILKVHSIHYTMR